MHKKIKKLMLNASAFRKFYMIALSFELIVILEIPSAVAKSLVLFWGFFILIQTYFLEKCVLKVENNRLLLSFIISMILTCFLNFTIWIAPNLVIVAYISILFFVFYGMHTEKNSRDSIEHEMLFVFQFFAYFSAITGAVSLIFMILKPSLTVSLYSPHFDSQTSFLYGLGVYGERLNDLFLYHLGIDNERFVGIFTNANILAIDMGIGIISCDFLSDSYFYNKYKEKLHVNRWILWVMVLIQCCCLFVSDSNAAFIFLIIYVCIRVFWRTLLQDGIPTGKKIIKSFLLIIGFGAVMMSASFVVRNGCQKVVSEIVAEVDGIKDAIKHKEFTHRFEEFNKKINENSKKTSIPDLQLGRQNYEIGSGRLILWKQGLEIFKKYPIFGIGRYNLVSYGEKIISDGLIFPDLHNAYLSILVSNGIIGFLIFGIFSLIVALKFCKYIFANYDSEIIGVFTKLFSALVAYCGYAFFEKSIIYDMTFAVGFFWLILGYAQSFYTVEKQNKAKSR